MSRRKQRRPRQRLNPDERWEQILHEATMAFYVNGYGQTSMRDLAHAVDMSVAGLYHYFDTKDDLLFTIVESAVSRLLAELKAARNSADTPEERIRAMLAATIRVVVENRAAIRIQIDNADKLPPERREIIRAKQRETAMMVRSELEQLRNSGHLKELHLNVLTFALNGMANWIYHWYRSDGPIDVDTLAEQLAEVFFYGILKR